MAVPLLNSLRKTFKDSEIDLATYEENICILENKEIIDNILGINKRERNGKFNYFLKSMKILKKKYDIIIELPSDKKSSILDMFSFGAKYKIKKDDGKFFNGSGYLVKEIEYYDEVEKIGAKYKIKKDDGKFFNGSGYLVKEIEHYDEVEKNLEYLKPLEKIDGVKVIYDKEIALQVSQDEKNEIRERMKKEGVDFSSPIFSSSLFLYPENDFFPVEEMKKLIEKLAMEKLNIVFYYEKGNKRKTAKFVKELKNNKNVFMFEIEDLKDYKGFFANSNFFFGTETKERYIAQGVGVPSFIIFEDQEKWISNYGEKFQGIVSNKIKKEYSGVMKQRIFEEMNCENIYKNIERMLRENKVIG